MPVLNALTSNVVLGVKLPPHVSPEAAVAACQAEDPLLFAVVEPLRYAHGRWPERLAAFGAQVSGK